MKIVNTMKGACLLLLGLAAASCGQTYAADIMTTSFYKLADTDTAGMATTGTPPAAGAGASGMALPSAPGNASTGPFLEEAPSPPTVSSAMGTGMGMASAGVGMSGTPCGDDDAFFGDPGCFWFRGEYMQWWTNGAHVPPLVSTVTNLNNPTGSLATLFGNRAIDDGQHDGYRLDFGMWLDKCHCWGLEADYYDFQGRGDGYDSGLTGGYQNGNVFPVVRAYYDPSTITQGFGQPLGAQVNAVGYPSQYVGRVTVDTNDFFQSAGIWLRHNLRASEWLTNGRDVFTTDPAARTFRLDVIGGYRFSRLIDYVDIRDDEVNINLADANYLNVFTNVDNFHAANTFNGGEIGLDTVMTAGRWSLDLLGKIAFGANSQDIQLYGLTQVDASETGGAITRASTTESLDVTRFSWMPELTATAGYQLTDHIKFTIAYDIIYWSEVARAGNQIAAEPTTGLPYGPQPTLTPSTVNEGYFWAEGFRLGGEVRY